MAPEKLREKEESESESESELSQSKAQSSEEQTTKDILQTIVAEKNAQEQEEEEEAGDSEKEGVNINTSNTAEVLQDIVEKQNEENEKVDTGSTTKVLSQIAKEQSKNEENEQNNNENINSQGNENALKKYADDNFEETDSEGDEYEYDPVKRLEQRRNLAWKHLYSTDTSEHSKVKTNQKARKGKTKTSIRSSRERLSKPKRKSKQSQNDGFILLDDARHCTFKPKLNPKSKTLITKSRGDFGSRVQSAEELRRMKLEKKQGEKEYNAKVDKKMCKDCGTVQTYDEFRKHKHRCSNCRKPYTHKNVWRDVGKSFFKRMEDHERKKKERLNKIENDVRPPFRTKERIVYDPTLNTSRKIQTSSDITWNEIRHSFLSRMENDSRRRKEKSALAESDYLLDPNCTFNPVFHSKNNSRSEYEHLNYGGFLERMEDDKDRRQRKELEHRALAKQAWVKERHSTRSSFESVGAKTKNPTGRWI